MSMTMMNLIMDKELWFNAVPALGTDAPLCYSWAKHHFILIATSATVLLSLLFVFFDRFFAAPIKNAAGRPIKELTTDARVMKFVSSLELSEKGKALAGNEPFMIRNGRARELVITQPEHLRDFYKDDTKHHPKPPNLNMGEYFRGILGDAVGAQAGERWKIIRKYFDPEFSFQASRQAIPKFTARITQWTNDLGGRGQTNGAPASTFVENVKGRCRFLTFQLVAQQMYGEVYDDKLYMELLKLNDLHEVVLHDVILNRRLVSKLWNWIDRAAASRMNEYNARWRDFNIEIIQKARTQGLDCPIERIFRGVDQANELKLTEFLHTLDEVLFANVDVSAAVLTTMFNNLAAHTTFQSALRTEILSQKDETQNSFDVAKYVAKSDSLLNCLVMESMRLSPAFAFSLPECTALPKTIGGYHVPARTAVVIDTRRLNTDSVTWGDDGEIFRPERFLQIVPAKCRYGFMRFGAGGASGRCLGKNVADIVFKLTAIEVLQRYSLTISKNQTEGLIEFTRLCN